VIVLVVGELVVDEVDHEHGVDDPDAVGEVLSALLPGNVGRVASWMSGGFEREAIEQRGAASERDQVRRLALARPVGRRDPEPPQQADLGVVHRRSPPPRRRVGEPQRAGLADVVLSDPMTVGEIDIDDYLLDPVTLDSDDSPALCGWEKVSSPALTDDATLGSRQDHV
jgi:hypothetical protein